MGFCICGYVTSVNFNPMDKNFPKRRGKQLTFIRDPGYVFD